MKPISANRFDQDLRRKQSVLLAVIPLKDGSHDGFQMQMKARAHLGALCTRRRSSLARRLPLRSYV